MVHCSFKFLNKIYLKNFSIQTDIKLRPLKLPFLLYPLLSVSSLLRPIGSIKDIKYSF